MTDITNESGVFETRDDAGGGSEGDVKYWAQSLKLYKKTFDAWHDECKRVIDVYRGESKNRKRDSFNILRSNIRTLRPSLYNSTPSPDIRRRNGDRDPVARQASEILERCVAYGLDDGDFDAAMLNCVHDQLIVGRGVAWARFVPAVADEQIVSANVEFDHVQWCDFAHTPSKSWQDVTWVARKHLMTKEALTALAGKDVSRDMDYDADIAGDAISDSEKSGSPSVFKRATCWEIWDAEERKQIWIAPSYTKAPLLVEDDPLKLKHFFPCPRPLYDDNDSTTLVPIPDYESYREQAEELSQVTDRIKKITSVLKWRGVYDKTLTAMANIQTLGDGELIAEDNVMAILSQQGGSLQNAIWLMPIEVAAQVLQHLYQAREMVKQTIYEISGISDIQRGATDANETLGAQQIKAQFGAGRVNERQRFVQRFVRDALRIKAEIMAEHVPFELLMQMAGVNLPRRPQQPQLMQGGMA